MNFNNVFNIFHIIFVLNSVLVFSRQLEVHNKVKITTSGSVEGNTLKVLDKEIEEYLGIPYAEPPVGNLRFAKPKPIIKPNEKIIDCKKIRNSCIQPAFAMSIYKGESSEDCLFLNIWSPLYKNGTELKSVMFWIHGGALSFGSINEEKYNGSVLATQDVVLVTVNYRLGWFGFLYGGDESAPGNVGFFDQVLALKWVRDNIHLFGGDKNQITIFGQSAGGWSVSAHILSPISKGLFRRAVLKAGAHLYNKNRPIFNRSEGLINAKEFAKSLSCTGDGWLKCLREVHHDKLESKIEITYPVDGTEFLPLLARKAMETGNFNKDIDIIAGVAKDEGSMITYLMEIVYIIKKDLNRNDYNHLLDKIRRIYHINDFESIEKFYSKELDINKDNSTAIKWKTFEFVGHITLVCPTYTFAKLYSKYSSNNTNVYFYEITGGAYNKRYGFDWGVYHGSDYELVFGHPILYPNSTSAENIEFSKRVMKVFTDFAKTGKPDKDWPKLTETEAQPDLDIIREINPKYNNNSNNKYMKDRFKHICSGIWKDYF